MPHDGELVLLGAQISCTEVTIIKESPRAGDMIYIVLGGIEILGQLLPSYLKDDAEQFK